MLVENKCGHAEDGHVLKMFLHCANFKYGSFLIGV